MRYEVLDTNNNSHVKIVVTLHPSLGGGRHDPVLALALAASGFFSDINSCFRCEYGDAGGLATVRFYAADGCVKASWEMAEAYATPRNIDVIGGKAEAHFETKLAFVDTVREACRVIRAAERHPA